MNNYAVIPARGGSKGLPDKNIRLLAGVPLIAWTIRAAIEANCFERVIVSTDCPKIASLSVECGAEVPFLRPEVLASDTSKTVDTVIHLGRELELRADDQICLLQPTSPLRQALDILKSLKLMKQPDVVSVIAVARFKLAAEWLMQMEPDGVLLLPEVSKVITNRQESLPTYYPNGAVYWCQFQAMVEVNSLIIPKAVGYEMDYWNSVDIDSIEDFEVAEFLFEQRRASSVDA